MKRITENDAYYLICLMEECAEITQRISKAFRFGIDNVHPKYGEDSNRVLLAQECGDILGVIDELIAFDVIDIDIINEYRARKPDRIRKYKEEYHGQ